MELLELRDAALTSPPPAAGAPVSPASKPAPIIDLRDHRGPTTFPLDDLRQLTVVVWARTQLIGRLLAAQGLDDARLRAGLGDIDDAVAAIGSSLDAFEDALPRRTA
jgi:hypothetical protein